MDELDFEGESSGNLRQPPTSYAHGTLPRLRFSSLFTFFDKEICSIDPSIDPLIGLRNLGWEYINSFHKSQKQVGIYSIAMRISHDLAVFVEHPGLIVLLVFLLVIIKEALRLLSL